ncbi:hypothetical protein SS1G_00044 [Sclerotinia sclerotiorum 1980 UF-70]|uniref:Ribonuclease T2-like n=1 Tax=Sclerotinia sclerotiorum (strain ATCC 18683 / 1980 / Ss-1) TaxID=665079 RepID=A7E422_SCLS1|nr:hypothetical protein SS1G_00044 [Sclerotinia sclerotiorum 1980 UF-70]EDN90644.1 hypothetical protein SS1G_00044 [Sclerotinia sclerotiorum 1980 UF-70]
MISSISKVILPFVLLAPATHAASLAATPLVCSNPALSCSGSSTNTCCFNTPGGQMVQTQFWDSDPSTGPSDSWTIHGLWPDHCDGTYDSNCDSSRAYSSITNILSAAGQTSLLSSYTTGAEVVDFFNVAVDLFKILPTYTWLANAGIVPSNTKTYTSAQIQAALTAGFGYPATIQCSSSSLNAVWYSFEVRGSVATGTFVPIAPVGQSGSCPSSGIKYGVKSGSSSGGGGGSGTPTTTATAPVGTGSFSGSGYLQAYAGGSNNGCLISAGTWYTTGTCATYTATPSGSGFTLKSSKGACGISGSTFSCGSGVSSTVFGSSGGYLTYGGSSTFYATSTPSGSTQATVYTSSQSVSVQFAWQSK